MANQMTVARVQSVERDKAIRYNVVLSGNYTPVANGGEAGAVGNHKLSTAFSSGRHLNNGLGG